MPRRRRGTARIRRSIRHALNTRRFGRQASLSIGFCSSIATGHLAQPHRRPHAHQPHRPGPHHRPQRRHRPPPHPPQSDPRPQQPQTPPQHQPPHPCAPAPPGSAPARNASALPKPTLSRSGRSVLVCPRRPVKKLHPLRPAHRVPPEADAEPPPGGAKRLVSAPPTPRPPPSPLRPPPRLQQAPPRPASRRRPAPRQTSRSAKRAGSVHPRP